MAETFDHTLIDSCIKGDRAAQKALYDRLAPRMFPLCIRYVSDRDLAEDVLTRWHNGEHGIPTDLVFFRSDGQGHNTFYSECFGGHTYTYKDMEKEKTP